MYEMKWGQYESHRSGHLVRRAKLQEVTFSFEFEDWKIIISYDLKIMYMYTE